MPLFKYMPHRRRLLEPNACDVRVSCAASIPTVNENTIICATVNVKPTTDIYIVLSSCPAKNTMQTPFKSTSRFVIMDGIASLKNVLSILPRLGGGEAGLNISSA